MIEEGFANGDEVEKKFKVIIADYLDNGSPLHKFENKSHVVAKSIKYSTTVASPLLEGFSSDLMT